MSDGPAEVSLAPLLLAGAVLAPQKGAADAAAGPNYVTVDRNLAMELVRVTEAAALAGGAWLGKVGAWHPASSSTLYGHH